MAGHAPSSPSEGVGSHDEEGNASTMDEAIAIAEDGTQVQQVQVPSAPGDSGESRREEIGDVEGAT
jgi:hypothetical protein